MHEMIITLLVCHWIGDFILQSDWIASNKSKNFCALLLHVTIYSYVIFLGMTNPWLSFFHKVSIESIIWFVFLNFLLHLFTDFFTSRLTSYFWKQNNNHYFFIVLGLDQLIHQICLIYTAKIIFSSWLTI